MFVAYTTDTGEIQRVKNSTIPPRDIEGETIVSEEGSLPNPATEYYPGGVRTPRPALSLPATHALPAGADWTIPDVPDGTRVHDTPGGEMGVADGGLIRTWLEPGEYEMRLEPPFPWMPATCRVTVT